MVTFTASALGKAGGVRPAADFLFCARPTLVESLVPVRGVRFPPLPCASDRAGVVRIATMPLMLPLEKIRDELRGWMYKGMPVVEMTRDELLEAVWWFGKQWLWEQEQKKAKRSNEDDQVLRR